MRERADSFLAPDGARLHYRAWEAARPAGVLAVAHGLGEHSGRYADLAGRLALERVSTFAHDHRGHGLSAGQRGHVRRFDHYVDDLARFLDLVRAAAPPGVPRFLLGHSMGGLVALRYLQRHRGTDLRGALLSSPLLGVALRVPAWKAALTAPLSRLLPRLPFSSGIDPAWLSHDPGVVRAYRDDPLVHDRITPRLYAEMLGALADAWRDERPLPVPSLFLVAGADRVTSPAAALAFAGRLDPARATVRHYPGLYHETFHEPERGRVASDLVRWIGENSR